MSSSSGEPRPRLAIFAGPTATILNSHPLVTSRSARRAYGLPDAPGGLGERFDALRPQRLAAPVTVYVEQFSAHALEQDSAELYAPPDGYLDPATREFSLERRSEADTPVYEVVLRPEDGLYPLPYMARRADGGAWEGDAVDPERPQDGHRQPFYPDASRLFEEIDRFEIGPDGHVNQLSSLATFDFFRPAPSGGYTKGLTADRRTDAGEDDVPPEVLGRDFFPYRPVSLRREPPVTALARATNTVQRVLASGEYAGALWIEGSPYVEETSYWLNLLIDTPTPFVTTAGQIGSFGAANVIDAVRYLTSGISTDEEGRDRLGVVCIEEEQVFTAREVQKSDDRPGGYVATGGHGGVVASMGRPGPPSLTFLPARRHTHRSAVCTTRLPRSVTGLRRHEDGRLEEVVTDVMTADGELLAAAMPSVRIIKHVRYLQRRPEDDDTVELELFARLRRDLRSIPLVGFVVEAGTPYGDVTAPLEAGLRQAAFSGVPVVKVGRGDVGGFVPVERVDLAIAGGNLTATKARLLLMACLLRFGALPLPRDPEDPTREEVDRIRERFAQYQSVFGDH